MNVIRSLVDDIPVPVAVTDANGVGQVLGIDNEGSLRTWDLASGEQARCLLDFREPRPDEEWYREEGLWDEEDDVPLISETEPTPEEMFAAAAAGCLEGRPVLVTGGGRFDLTQYDEDRETMGAAVRAWDVATGRMVGRLLPAHTSGIWSLAVVESERGPIALSGGEDAFVKVWDLARSELIVEFGGHRDGMRVAAAQVGDRLLAVSAGHDRQVLVWDVLRGEAVGEPLAGHGTVVRAVAISWVNGLPCAVTSGDDLSVRIWSLLNGEQVGAPLTGHTDVIHAMGVTSVDGRPVAVTGSSDNTVRIWDLSRGEQIGDPLTGHQTAINSITTGQAAGTPIVVTSDGQSLHAWDLSTL